MSTLMTSANKLRRTMLQLAAVALVAGMASPAWSQPKNVRMVIAFPAGGPVDFVGRSISDALGKELGAQVIVENKPGANGIIAAEYVIKSPPDGTVLWFTSVGAVAINPGLYPNLPYDPHKDLAPISLVVRNDELLVVGTANPATGPTDFVANAKKQRTTMASSGMGSPHSSAPCATQARSTVLANAFSFRRFKTDSTGTSAILFEGRTSAQAPTKPVSSSTARRAFAILVSRGIPV